MSDKAYLAALHRVDELKRQRDQLREALKVFAKMDYGEYVDSHELELARAVLAATEEG